MLGIVRVAIVMRRATRPITVYDVARDLLAALEAEAADAAKRARRIAWVKRGLSAMGAGDSDWGLSYFDEVMTAFCLKPEDFGATAREIESAKAAWVEKQAS